jgi:hypothetical protein
MTKSSAFGTILKRGVCQVESTPIVGAITGSGNATVTVTKAGMTGSPLAIVVAVLNGDTTDTVATKMVAAMNLIANFNAKCVAWCSGSILYVGAIVAIANDGTMNIAYTNTTCAGLTPDATSDHAVAGVVPTTIAQVVNIGGPGLALDTEDVTTHDQATAFEEVVATVLRSGEIKVDLVYDPNAATHSASANGLIDDIENKIYAYYQLIFPGPYTWSFQGRGTGFESSAAFDGALTASATIKITGQPTLV